MMPVTSDNPLLGKRVRPWGEVRDWDLGNQIATATIWDLKHHYYLVLFS